MNKLAAMAVTGLIVTTCSTPANANIPFPNQSIVTTQGVQNIDLLIAEEMQRQAEIKKLEAKKAKELDENTEKINQAISKLEKHIGKTWYVFSGSTPSGWDCSGMVMWTYQQIDIELEHRASKQAKAGKIVESPKLGDIVVFKYSGSKSAYHVGIWIEEDTMIHAGGKKGERTEIKSIDKFAGNYSKVSYVRILETNE